MDFLVELKMWQGYCTGPHNDVLDPCKIYSDDHNSTLNKSGCTNREAHHMKNTERVKHF